MSKRTKEGEQLTADEIENFMAEEVATPEETRLDPNKPYTPKTQRPIKDEDGNEYEGTRVRVNREDGKYKKSIPLQVQGLSSQMLPPITRRGIARYEVIGTDSIDPLTKQIIDTIPPLIIPGGYVIYDPFEKNVMGRDKYLKNVTRNERVIRDGKSVVEELVEDIVFNDGILSVAIEKEYLLYVLLELHPLNESYKWRPQGVAAAFRRTDIGKRKKWEETAAGMDLAFEAEKSIVDMRKSEDIISYAHAAGIQTMGRMLESGDNSVKTDLRRFARQNPIAFFKLNKNEYMAIKITTMNAFDMGLIDYRVDKRMWIFTTDDSLLGQHLPGEEPMDAIVKLLQKEEYRPQYEKMEEMLNFWE